MGIKEVEEMSVKNWVSTGASMDDTRKRLLYFSGIYFSQVVWSFYSMVQDYCSQQLPVGISPQIADDRKNTIL